MLSPERAVELLFQISLNYSDGSDEKQSLEMASELLRQTETDPEIIDLYKQKRMQIKLEKSCSNWLSENTNAKAGTTVIICAIIHVVSFDENYQMQLTPVFFDYLAE